MRKFMAAALAAVVMAFAVPVLPALAEATTEGPVPLGEALTPSLAHPYRTYRSDLVALAYTVLRDRAPRAAAGVKRITAWSEPVAPSALSMSRVEALMYRRNAEVVVVDVIYRDGTMLELRAIVAWAPGGKWHSERAALGDMVAGPSESIVSPGPEVIL